MAVRAISCPPHPAAGRCRPVPGRHDV